MTNKEFEAQKQELIEQLNIINQFGFDYNDYVYLHDTISELQPPRPTCITCEHSTEIVKWGELEMQCCNPEVHTHAANYDFGCILHSSYGDAK